MPKTSSYEYIVVHKKVPIFWTITYVFPGGFFTICVPMETQMNALQRTCLVVLNRLMTS